MLKLQWRSTSLPAPVSMRTMVRKQGEVLCAHHLAQFLRLPGAMYLCTCHGVPGASRQHHGSVSRLAFTRHIHALRAAIRQVLCRAHMVSH